jgi:hypothetical protein
LHRLQALSESGDEMAFLQLNRPSDSIAAVELLCGIAASR